MDYKNNTRELCFSLKLFNTGIDNDILIDDFIDFATRANISIAGNVDGGFCFSTHDNRLLPHSLKQDFINHLQKEYFSKIETICLEVYDEDLDEFKIIEKIQITPDPASMSNKD